MPSVSINKVAEGCAMRMKLACHPPSLLFDCLQVVRTLIKGSVK
jgi:hypothetical protein